MATATATKNGIQIQCPKCGAAEGLTVRVHNLALECSECLEDVSRADVERLIADAQRLLCWLDMAGR